MILRRAIAPLMLGLATLPGHAGNALASGEGEALYQAVCRACHAPEKVMVRPETLERLQRHCQPFGRRVR